MLFAFCEIVEQESEYTEDIKSDNYSEGHICECESEARCGNCAGSEELCYAKPVSFKDDPWEQYAEDKAYCHALFPESYVSCNRTLYNSKCRNLFNKKQCYGANKQSEYQYAYKTYDIVGEPDLIGIRKWIRNGLYDLLTEPEKVRNGPAAYESSLVDAVRLKDGTPSCSVFKRSVDFAYFIVCQILISGTLSEEVSLSLFKICFCCLYKTCEVKETAGVVFDSAADRFSLFSIKS